MPEMVKVWVDSRFNKDEAILANGAAFDLVSASVNLVLAGLLIALGTSLKLPLSTTYVAFMVAMGSSLADRAWGRESAVFRVTGVLSVIGGWFITAGAAFIFCFLCESIMFPTIFALAIRGTGTHTKRASSFLIMSIVGGAVAPLAMGYIADHASMALGFVVPLGCFLYITLYAVTYPRKK